MALALLAVAGTALARLLVGTVVLDDRRQALHVATALTRDASERLAGDACAPEETPVVQGRVHLERRRTGSARAPRQALTVTLAPSAGSGGAPRTLAAVAAGWCP